MEIVHPREPRRPFAIHRPPDVSTDRTPRCILANGLDRSRPVLCVVNYEPIARYRDLGHSLEMLRRYYNPNGYFSAVHIVAVDDGEWDVSPDVHVHGARGPDLLARVVSVARATGASVIRNFEAFPTHLVAVRAAAILDVPAVISLHDVMSPSTVTLFDHVFAYVEWLRDRVRAQHGYRNASFLPNRIDEGLFTPGPPRSIEVEGSPRFVCVGRLDERTKNIGTLLRAIDLVRDRLPDLRLAVIGEGPGRADYERLIEELKLGSRVRLVGNQREDRVADWYRWCDAHVLVNDSGDLGRSLVESLIAGKPVVATGGRGNSLHHLEHGANAFLVPIERIRDPAAIAEGLVWMAENHSRLDPAAIRERAVAEYGYDRWARVEAETYAAVIAAFRARPPHERLWRRLRVLLLSSIAGTSGPTRPLRIAYRLAQAGMAWRSPRRAEGLSSASL